MRIALLVTDLEGVAGVDDLSSLVAGAPGYPRACALLTAETNAAVRGLLQAGFDHVRISDSHRAGSGGANIDASLLPPEASLHLTDDAYAPELFEGVSAIAALGMHAPAGTKGFAAHTVDVHCDWRLGRARLSEADLVLALAAERELPAIFASGDDVLGAQLAGRVAYVETKASLGTAASRSRSEGKVLAAIERAAGRKPKRTRAPSASPLSLSFKSGWQLRAAFDEQNCSLVGAQLRFDAGSLRDNYSRALAACTRISSTLAQVPRSYPGVPSFVTDAVALLSRRLPRRAPAPQPERARATLKAFLQRTGGRTGATASWQRSDRALTLHMLSHLAPALFAKQKLRPVLDESLRSLAAIPRTFEPGLHPAEAMSRVDAAYLERLYGITASPPLDEPALRTLLFIGSFHHGRTWAWLLGELATRAGHAARVVSRPALGAEPDRTEELYLLTHLFMLETDYFAKPLPSQLLWAETERLLLAAPWTLEHRSVDLAAELCICLRAAGESRAPECTALVRFLARWQRPDGTVVDPTIPPGDPDEERRVTHATAAALLAFAATVG